MDRRLELQEIFSNAPGVAAAYFQPPGGTQMKFPCIVYEMSRESVVYGDNAPYHLRRGYTATAIDRDPDSQIPGYLSRMPMCRFDRHFVSDHLHHWVYTIY